MKGIIFREFIGMVETQFSVQTADDIITASNLKSNGAYTTVGTYPIQEITALVTQLSVTTQMPVPGLLNAFGRYLFQRFSVIHAEYVSPNTKVFELLSLLDNHIHVEVRKLYSDAELPSFTHEMLGPDCMLFIYRSKNMLADFAEGMLQGCIAYFNEQIHIDRQDLVVTDGAHTRFVLTRLPNVIGS